MILSDEGLLRKLLTMGHSCQQTNFIPRNFPKIQLLYVSHLYHMVFIFFYYRMF